MKVTIKILVLLLAVVLAVERHHDLCKDEELIHLKPWNKLINTLLI